MFERIYGSVWHHPFLFWLAGGGFLLWLLTRAPSRRGFVPLFALLFVAEILVDAWLTSALSPLPTGSVLATASAIVFVVLGDLRYLVLLERFRAPSPTPVARWLPVALGLSLVVPIGSKLIADAIAPGEPRKLFAIYELMFALLALALWRLRVPRDGDPAIARWLRRLTAFEVAQYALWSSADAVILAGHDIGYGLRLIPNTMYYAAFMPFCYLTAPPGLKR
jgi:hypothetical protein